MEVENKLEEELFCLKFELDAMSELLIYSNAERWIYKMMHPMGEKQHLNRYIFAKSLVENKVVLDIAGGCGYGTYFLAEEGKPKEIHSVDLSPLSVRYANHRHPHPKVSRFVDNAETYVKDNYYDTVVSFETIEHLKNHRQFLESIKRSLKPGGTLVISTPINNKTTEQNINPYHVIEWSFGDFQKLIAEYFDIEHIYVQNILEKKDIVDSFFKRMMHKFFPSFFRKNDPSLVAYSAQFNPQKVAFGFQLLVCKNK